MALNCTFCGSTSELRHSATDVITNSEHLVCVDCRANQNLKEKTDSHKIFDCVLCDDLYMKNEKSMYVNLGSFMGEGYICSNECKEKHKVEVCVSCDGVDEKHTYKYKNGSAYCYGCTTEKNGFYVCVKCEKLHTDKDEESLCKQCLETKYGKNNGSNPNLNKEMIYNIVKAEHDYLAKKNPKVLGSKLLDFNNLIQYVHTNKSPKLAKTRIAKRLEGVKLLQLKEFGNVIGLTLSPTTHIIISHSAVILLDKNLKPIQTIVSFDRNKTSLYDALTFAEKTENRFLFYIIMYHFDGRRSVNYVLKYDVLF